MVRIAIVDDQNIFRQSLDVLIKSFSEFEVVASAAGGVELLATLEGLETLPDILLMDMDMPGMNGLELNQVLVVRYPSIKIIVLSVHAQERLISKMIAAGASAYLVKNCDKEELYLALQTVSKTGFYMSAQVLKAISNTSDKNSIAYTHVSHIPVELTSREKEILILICKEMGSAEIASQLFISPRTVEGHRNNLLLKTNSKNTAGLVLFAAKYHIIEITL